MSLLERRRGREKRAAAGMKGRYRRQPCLQQGFCTGAAKPSSSKSTHRHLPPAQLEKKKKKKKSQLILLGSCMKKKVCHTRRDFFSLDHVAPEVMPHLWVVISCISLRNWLLPWAHRTDVSMKQPAATLSVPDSATLMVTKPVTQVRQQVSWRDTYLNRQ